MTLPPDGAGVFCAPAQGLCALQPGKTFSVAQFACLSVCEHFFFTVHFLFPYLGKLLTRNRSQLAESAGVSRSHRPRAKFYFQLNNFAVRAGFNSSCVSVGCFAHFRFNVANRVVVLGGRSRAPHSVGAAEVLHSSSVGFVVDSHARLSCHFCWFTSPPVSHLPQILNILLKRFSPYCFRWCGAAGATCTKGRRGPA